MQQVHTRAGRLSRRGHSRGSRRQGATRHPSCRDSRETSRLHAGPGPRGARAQDSPGLRSWTRLGLPPRLGGCRGCVRRRVRGAGAGGSRLAKSVRGTGSVEHPPGVRVSQRETEEASYRGAGWGWGYATTLSPPRPPSPLPPRRDADSHSLLRNLDTKTACQLQAQVFPKPSGTASLYPVTNGPWILDPEPWTAPHPLKHSFPPCPGRLHSPHPGQSLLG